MVLRIAITIVIFYIIPCSYAQDSSIIQLPSKYLDNVSSKANQLEQKLDQKADRALDHMMKLEVKMKKKLAKVDSLKAIEVFGNVEEKYQMLRQRLMTKLPGKKYIPSLDTLSTSLKFLQQNPQLMSHTKEGEQKVKEALVKVNGLEEQFQKAEEIKKFLKERKQLLKTQLEKFHFAKQLKKLNKQVYYYSEQMNEYSAVLKDHKKAERKALELLSKTKLFQDFMHKNSMLASLFRFTDDPTDPLTQANLAGLQTRAQVNNLIQQQVARGGPNSMSQFRQNMQTAQSQIDQLKSKINQFSSSSSDDIMPDGFKPNNQKTKSFFNRLEYSANIQSQKPNGYFPVTSDIGLSMGYKLNSKSIIGIGASYKLGWGENIRHIDITSQGAGLRSFIDWQIKGSFWVSGGYEMNYQSEFNRINELKYLNAWQQSGLIGLSKVVSIRSKFFKKTKFQLLWDFLSYQQLPKTQAILFRVNYSFK